MIEQSNSIFQSRRFTHWQLLLVTWFVYSAHAAIVPHLPRYYDLDLHLSDQAIGMLMAMPALLTLLMQPLWGILADRYLGRTNTYRLSISLGCVFLLCMPFVYDLGGYYLLICTACLMYTCFISNGPILSSLVFSFLGKENSHKFSQIRVAGSISFAFTMLFICPLLIELSAWMQWLPRTGILFGAAFFIIMSFCFTFWDRSHFEPEVRTPLHSFTALLKDKNLIVLYLSIFCVSSGTSAGIQYMGPYIGHLGYSDRFYGLVWFMGITTEVGVSIFLARIVKKVGLKRVIIFGFLADSIRWAGLYCFVEPQWIILFTLLHGLVVIAIFFASPIYLDAECDSDIRSTAQSMIYFCLLGGQINGYLTSSWIVSQYSHLPRAEAIQNGFIWFALASFIGATVCVLGMKDNPPKPSEPPLPIEEMVG